jgi:hypothetical protein
VGRTWAGIDILATRCEDFGAMLEVKVAALSEQRNEEAP